MIRRLVCRPRVGRSLRQAGLAQAVEVAVEARVLVGCAGAFRLEREVGLQGQDLAGPHSASSIRPIWPYAAARSLCPKTNSGLLSITLCSSRTAAS